LAKLAVTGGGPEYEMWGRIPYYPTTRARFNETESLKGIPNGLGF
jgi:hypothetical protein